MSWRGPWTHFSVYEMEKDRSGWFIKFQVDPNDRSGWFIEFQVDSNEIQWLIPPYCPILVLCVVEEEKRMIPL